MSFNYHSPFSCLLKPTPFYILLDSNLGGSTEFKSSSKIVEGKTYLFFEALYIEDSLIEAEKQAEEHLHFLELDSIDIYEASQNGVRFLKSFKSIVKGNSSINFNYKKD